VPTGRYHEASSGCFPGGAASEHAVDLPYASNQPAFIQRQRGLAVITLDFIVVRVRAVGCIFPSSPSFFTWSGRFITIHWTLPGCFPDSSNRLSQCCPVRGQPRDGSQATKFWMVFAPSRGESIGFLAGPFVYLWRFCQGHL
jgi:hypothetical protein